VSRRHLESDPEEQAGEQHSAAREIRIGEEPGKIQWGQLKEFKAQLERVLKERKLKRKRMKHWT
jgi:hypothetical protein